LFAVTGAAPGNSVTAFIGGSAIFSTVSVII
jgi:hypothetical protein